MPAFAAFASNAPWPLAIRETMAALSREEQDAFFDWVAEQRFPARTIARLEKSFHALGFEEPSESRD